MAQLPKHHKIKTKTRLNKNGFLYCVLSGYGVKDWHINVLVLVFFVLGFCNVILFTKANLSFYDLSKVLAIITAIAFIIMGFANKYLLISSAFWQPRLVILMFIPALFFVMMFTNALIPIDERTLEFQVNNRKRGVVYLKNINGAPFDYHEKRVHRYDEEEIRGFDFSSKKMPDKILVTEEMGIFGVWLRGEVTAVYYP